MLLDFLPLVDCISASLVCRTWRTALSNEAPSHWAKVCSEQVRKGCLGVLLARSKDADLSLEAFVDDDNADEIADCITQHIGRCNYLKVVFNDGVTFDGAAKVTQALCSGPAPRLRTFKLYDHLSKFNKSRDCEVSLFCGQAPRLHLVKLHLDHRAIAGCTALGVARRLLFASTTDSDTISYTRTILDMFPLLEAFGLELDSWNWQSWDEGTAETVHFPASLQDLVLISNQTEVDPIEALRGIDIPRDFRRICVSYNRPPDEPDSTIAVTQHLVNPEGLMANMHIDTSTYSSGVNIDLWWDETTPAPVPGEPRPRRTAKRTRTVLDIPETVRFPEAMFAGLVHLSLGELVLSAFDSRVEDGEEWTSPFPVLPVLRSLTILTLLPEYQYEDGHKSLFISPHPNLPPPPKLQCPSLEDLKFSAPMAGDAVLNGGTTLMAPHLILDILKHVLDYGQGAAGGGGDMVQPRRLRKLVFSGARVQESSPIEHIARMLDLADELCIEEGFVEAPRDIDDLLTWG